MGTDTRGVPRERKRRMERVMSQNNPHMGK
jgi:hypothetical protein